MIPRHLTQVLIFPISVMLTSCGKEEAVRVYEVIVPPVASQTESPADPDSAAQAAASAVAPPSVAPTQAPNQDQVSWGDVPAGWEPRPLSQFTNKGHFALPGEGPGRPVLTISAYPGAAGGLVANFNRWRGQIGLAALDEAVLMEDLENVTIGGQQVAICSYVGQQADGTPWATDGAVIMLPGEAWFFKLVGDPEQVAAVRGAFRGFVLGLKIGGAQQAASPAPAPTGPPAPEYVTPGSAPARVQYSTPEGWTENPAGGMREASFTIPGPDGADADVSLVRMGGGGARDSQNVNLWRQQLGLADLPEAEAAASMEKLTLGGHKVRVFDAASTDPMIQGIFKARILAAVIDHNGVTWVLRARGVAPHLEAERGRFLQLAESLRLP